MHHTSVSLKQIPWCSKDEHKSIMILVKEIHFGMFQIPFTPVTINAALNGLTFLNVLETQLVL